VYGNKCTQYTLEVALQNHSEPCVFQGFRAAGIYGTTVFIAVYRCCYLTVYRESRSSPFCGNVYRDSIGRCVWYKPFRHRPIRGRAHLGIPGWGGFAGYGRKWNAEFSSTRARSRKNCTGRVDIHI